jgi:hypothetical protein
VASVLLALGCEGEQWVVGEGIGPRVPRAGPSYGCASADDLLARRTSTYGASQVSERHVGRWSGRLGGSAVGAFPSDQVELTLGPDHSGTLRFVGAEPPPAPESALEGYLCDGAVPGGICGTPSGFVGGFAYELLGIGARGAVLSFVVIDADPWGPWCELQAPVESADVAAACGYTFTARRAAAQQWSEVGCTEVFGDGAEHPVDCALMYASERCQCGHDRCFSSFQTGIEVGLSLSNDGEELRGSLWFRSNLDASLLTLHRQL